MRPREDLFDPPIIRLPSLRRKPEVASLSNILTKVRNELFDGFSHLYKRVCQSVRQSDSFKDGEMEDYDCP